MAVIPEEERKRYLFLKRNGKYTYPEEERKNTGYARRISPGEMDFVPFAEYSE